MSGKKQSEVFERDNALVDILCEHKGKDNAIKTQELVRALGERGYSVHADCLHTIIKKVMFEMHLPICSIVHYGYYIATSEQDIQCAIDSIQDKINGMQERIDLLKTFICE